MREDKKIDTLIEVRDHLQMSQTEMAEKSGLKQSNISAYEGRKAGMLWETFFKIMYKIGIRCEVVVYIGERKVIINPARKTHH